MAKETRRPRDEDEDDEDDKPRKKRRNEEDDDEDDKPRKKARVEDEDEDEDRPAKKKKKGGGAVSQIIPYKNGAALAAYYCGVFGAIPILGMLLGPIAAALGILGIAKAMKMPKATGIGHGIAGILLGVVDTFIWQILWMTFLREMSKGA